MSRTDDPAEPPAPEAPPPPPDLHHGTPAGAMDDGLPGQALSTLLFACSVHGEERAVDYYDPADPPRCSRGDLMSRIPR